MGKYTDKSAFVLPRHVRLKNGINSVTLSASAKTLQYDDSMIQLVTCSGVSASTIVMPAPVDGVIYAINNDAGSGQSLNVNDHNGATKSTLAAGEGCLVACDGTNYFIIIKA